MKDKLRIGVIGIGHLGKYHAQKYTSLPECRLAAVCDTHQNNAEEIATSLGVSAFTDYRSLAGIIDAVSIVTPTIAHYPVAAFFLQQGIHVLLEKPMTASLEEADHLIQLAREKKAVLQIGHIERFNNVFQATVPLLKNVRFIEAMRLAPFKQRGSDISVVLDMMIHDIDLIQSIVKSPIHRISATGSIVLSSQIDIANARLEFADGSTANLTASRIHPRITRRMHIFQDDQFLNLDLQHKKLSICIPPNKPLKQSFPKDDPLKTEIACFLNAILKQTPPLVSGEDGRNALLTALQITESIQVNQPQFIYES